MCINTAVAIGVVNVNDLSVTARTNLDPADEAISYGVDWCIDGCPEVEARVKMIATEFPKRTRNQQGALQGRSVGDSRRVGLSKNASKAE